MMIFMKKTKKLINKLLIVFTVIGVFLTSFGLPFKLLVSAAPLDHEIEFVGGIKKGDFIEFLDSDTLMGKVEVKIGDVTLIPEDDNKIKLPEYTEEYELLISITEEEGYEARTYTINGGEEDYLPGHKNLYLNIDSSDGIVININFESLEDHPGGGGMMPMFNLPILAYLEGVVDPIESVEGKLLLPENWTNGSITFKVKACMDGENIVPNDGESNCDPGTETLVDLNIFGIANRDGIGRSVSGSSDNKSIIIDKNFKNYGKVGIHLGNEDFSGMLDIITHNLINVEANSPMRMDYSYGSSTLNQALVTSNETGSLSIFFGNTETMLRATGPNVLKISKVEGLEHQLQEDGSVIVMLPPLSKETTSKVTITIDLQDGSKVKRQINILRTAIELAYEGESKTIRAGYVIHKAYLYNNLPHNDNIFDAYLQVIIYRDNFVVGYKQIQIDDKDFVNSLEKDGSGSIDVASDGAIVVYDGKIEGANRVSVFLTNGPIKYNSDTLPSIEFGLGAGVELEWSPR